MRSHWGGAVMLALGALACATPTAERPAAAGLEAQAVGHPTGVLDLVSTLGGTPYGLAIAPNSKFILTTQLTGNAVARAPLPARTYGTFISVGNTPPHVAINPASTRAYVPNQLGHSVSILDLTTDQVIATLPLAGEGYNVAVHPNGSLVYITTNIGRMYVLSTASNTLTDSLDLDPADNGLAFGKGNLLFVSSLLSGTVTAINTATNRVVGQLVTGGRPQRMAVDPGSNELYVANEILGLDIWNLTTRTRVTTVAMDAYGLALSPDNAKVYVSGPLTGTLTIVNRATRTVDTTISVGGRPRNIAFLPNGRRAAVTNESGYVTWIR